MVWALDFNENYGTITNKPAVTAALVIEATIKVFSHARTKNMFLSSTTTNEFDTNFFGMGIDSNGFPFIQMGTNSRRVTGGTAVTVGAQHVLRAVFSGLDTVDPGSGQGTVELFLDGVSQGTATPHSGNLHAASRGINYIGNNSGSNSFDGLIYSIDIIGDTYDYQFDAETSSHAGGGQPVLSSSADSNAFTGNNFPTDGSAWIEEGSDVTDPDWTVPPSITNNSSTGPTISQTINEAGDIFAVRLASGATAPTPAQVIAGTDGDDVAALETQSDLDGAGSVNVDLTFTTASVSTTYDYYIVARDAAGNVQDSVTAITGQTTLGVSLNITGGVLRPGQTVSGTYAGIPDLSSPVTMQDARGNTMDVAVTDEGSGNFTLVMPSLPNTGAADLLQFGTVTVTGTPT